MYHGTLGRACLRDSNIGPPPAATAYYFEPLRPPDNGYLRRIHNIIMCIIYECDTYDVVNAGHNLTVLQ